MIVHGLQTATSRFNTENNIRRSSIKCTRYCVGGVSSGRVARGPTALSVGGFFFYHHNRFMFTRYVITARAICFHVILTEDIFKFHEINVNA